MKPDSWEKLNRKGLRIFIKTFSSAPSHLFFLLKTLRLAEFDFKIKKRNYFRVVGARGSFRVFLYYFSKGKLFFAFQFTYAKGKEPKSEIFLGLLKGKK